MFNDSTVVFVCTVSKMAVHRVVEQSTWKQSTRCLKFKRRNVFRMLLCLFVGKQIRTLRN